MLIIIVGVACLLTYVKAALPNVGPAPELKVERTPERVARGEYLANHVTICMDCHSTRDWSKFSGPLTPGTLGKGGELFDQKFTFPGAYYSRNITPAGISRYTDGELFRVITTGVDKEGKAIFPVMPYPYLWSHGSRRYQVHHCLYPHIKPIENKVPAPVSDFPMNFIINTIPSKAVPQIRLILLIP